MPLTSRPLALVILAGALAAAGCAPSATPAATPAPAPSPSPLPPSAALAPWAASAIPQAAVPPAYRSAFRAAENRARCALLAPARLDTELASAATARVAPFGGGWGVAYDLPGERSAFGVAGTGASAWSGDVYDAWPERRTFADGSRVGYGPEGGGVGPNWLAYLRIPGQDCLYNVWSRRGQAHLEELLAALRFVAPE